MSGPFGSSQWMYSSGAAFYPFAIDQSLRINDDDAAYLSRTPASAGNRKTWTYSLWVKRGLLNASGSLDLLVAGSNASGQLSMALRFENDKLVAYGAVAGVSADIYLVTNAVYRDTSSWYHIVLECDTTQATASDRVKLYVNGSQVTSFSSSTYPAQNYDTAYSNTVAHTIGRFSVVATNYFDGYLAEVNFIDGQALDPTSFGEFKSGVWIPKQYGGTYGTNGFRLSFADSSNIGDDTSGNTNDWTANSLVATDVLLDSPTNNFAVLNPNANVFWGGGGDIAPLQEGNLLVATTTSPLQRDAVGTIGVSSGKWYWEIVVLTKTSTSAWSYGVVSVDTGTRYLYYAFNGGKYITSVSTYAASWDVNDIMGIAFDADAGTITFYKNNVSQGIAFTGLSGTFLPLSMALGGDNYTVAHNFGQDSSFAGNKTAQGNTDDNGYGDFYYAPPSGYLALCTANLPDPVINPAQDDVPSDYFGTSLWSGNDTSQSISVGWQPDLVWLKSRNSTQPHLLYDAVRGAGANKDLSSNSTAAEGGTSGGFYGDVSSFDTNGFTVETGTSNAAYVNLSGLTYVGWSWLAGNGTSSNTSGSISSTVSVNQKAGFSVVSWTATSNGNDTVGHGLGVTPIFRIDKNRDSTEDWWVYTTASGGYQYLRLNTTGAAVSYGATQPTSSVFTTHSSATPSDKFISYCFAEVEGYSKFGSYVGNSSTDGPFVFCGFRPSFVLTKMTSSTGNWMITDNARNTYNLSDLILMPNNADTEYSQDGIDMLSNGFKLRASTTNRNTSGGTYIFMAFAENPFKYANAR